MRPLITLCVLAAIGCSGEPGAPAAATAPAPAPINSGIDRTAFDESVRAQDDLFQHVNGTWLKKNEIPADKSSYGSFDMLIDKSQADLRAIVEEAPKAPNKAIGSDQQKIGDFYESFTNETRADELGMKPLETELAAIDRIQTKTDLARHFAGMFKLNLLNPLVGYVEGDAQQPDREILYVVQGGLGLPDRDYYLKDEPALKQYREKYVAVLTEFLTLANQTAPDATARQIFDLETRLARAHWTNVESRDAVKTYNKRALGDLPKQSGVLTDVWRQGRRQDVSCAGGADEDLVTEWNRALGGP